jgi:pyroglutamyl-peptidase
VPRVREACDAEAVAIVAVGTLYIFFDDIVGSLANRQMYMHLSRTRATKKMESYHMKVHISGFGPFGKEKTNPTARLIEDLKSYRLDGASLQLHLLPVTVEGIREYAKLLHEESLNDEILVIAFGLAGGRKGMAVERVAINCFDFSIPDNDGKTLIDTPIVPGGPDAYFSGLPMKRILASWQRTGIPSYVSNTAGTYLCNGLFYLLRHYTRSSGARGGFIHVPYTGDIITDSSQPTMSYADVLSAAKIAIEVAVQYPDDEALPGGAIC